MNAPLLLSAALLAANPLAEQDSPVYTPSPQLAAAVRAQTPTYEEMPAVVAQDVTGQYTPPAEFAAPSVTYDPFVSGPAVPPAWDPYSAGVYAGYESVFLKPYFSSDAAFEETVLLTQSVTHEFDWDLEHSPRVWVGYSAPDGWGLQVRYWQFDHEVEQQAVDNSIGLGDPFYYVAYQHGAVLMQINTFLANAAAPQTILARHSLELHVTDFEGTWRTISSPQGSLTVTGGVRWVKMNQDYLAQVANTAGTGVFDQFFLTHHDFEGAGPTLSLLGRRRLGMSDFALFANGRLSGVYGDTSLRMEAGGPAAAFGSSSWVADGDALIAITELQAGVEWSTRLWILGGSRLFLRAALEGQLWHNAGTGMATTGDAGDNASPLESDLGLFGFAVGGGLTY